MKKITHFLSLFILLLFAAPSVLAKVLMTTPDKRVLQLKGGVMQPDLSIYRSPIDSAVIDRRFYQKEATFMANETFKFGMEGFNDMVKAGFPVAYRRGFQWITAREMYFYARYLLDFSGGRGHAGVHMLHGPYWTLKAQTHSAYNKVIRDHGERKFSNKDILLGFYLPLVYQRTGFPRVFEDIQLTYLPYKSVDPHFTGMVKSTDTFNDPMSGKKGGWGQPEAYFNDFPQRFDHDKMDTNFDMGGLGQFVKRRMQWSDLFFHSNHEEESTISKGTKVTLLGNDAEEGMRGWGLAMAALNTMLEVKSSMFTDGEHLMGINPASYDPSKGLRYIPHEITPNLLWIGDLPERVYSIEMADNSSQLWDQASWIWGTTAYATTVNRRTNAFTPNAPVDGGMIESSTSLVAESMANAIFKNIMAMHTENGILTSAWTPKSGKQNTISMKDMSMAMVALRDMAEGWKKINKYPNTVLKINQLIEKNAQFLLKAQQANGSFCESYQVTTFSPQSKCNQAAPLWGGIRALIAAYYTTENKQYLAAARRTFNLLNKSYWSNKAGVYRSKLGYDVVKVTPYDVGIMTGALREILFTTPTYMADPIIERIARWWVQTVDQSGLIQAETNRTGEIYTGFIGADDDGDGIPVVSKGNGDYGIAPLMAGRVNIYLNGMPASKMDLKHNVNKYHKVAMNYRHQDPSLVLPLTDPKPLNLITRKPMERIDGTTIPLAASKPIGIGLGIKNSLTGQQMYNANCALCHGEHGEGMDGHPLNRAMNWGSAAVTAFAYNGHFTGFMPPWGQGNNDGVGGPLTMAELKKIGEYIASDTFKANFKLAQSGQIVKGSLPKDVWFYLSRENIKAGGTKQANANDAVKIHSKFIAPNKIKTKPWENIER